MDGPKITYFLDIIDENTLIIQGVGRGTRELIHVIRDGNKILLEFSGFKFKKHN